MATMSPLRRRMIEDMTVRNLSPATQRSYVHAVAKFSRFFGHSPDRLGLEDVRAFQIRLVSSGISWPALNQTVCALRIFYGVTLSHGEIPKRMFCRLRISEESPHDTTSVRTHSSPLSSLPPPLFGGSIESRP
jgi:site-specific recombinase XerD